MKHMVFYFIVKQQIFSDLPKGSWKQQSMEKISNYSVSLNLCNSVTLMQHEYSILKSKQHQNIKVNYLLHPKRTYTKGYFPLNLKRS